jgi:hypothetical protein
MPLNIRPKDRAVLENEIVPREAKLTIAKILDRNIVRDGSDHAIQRRNVIVNKARTAEGIAPYVLDTDGSGDYLPQEMTWHEGEIRLALMRLGPLEFFDFVAALVSEGHLAISEVEEVFSHYSISAKLERETRTFGEDQYWMVPAAAIEPDDHEQTEVHATVRQLYDRAVRDLDHDDFAGVIHTAATIVENIAKTVVGNPNVINQPLGGWFNSYKNSSSLPGYILDEAIALYNRRNTSPNAGHGTPAESDVTREDAVNTIGLVRMIIFCENQFQKDATVTN